MENTTVENVGDFKDIYILKEELLKYLRNEYKSYSELEKIYNQSVEDSFKQGKPFTHRRKLKKQIEIIKEKKQQIELMGRNYKSIDIPIEEDFKEIINSRGYEFYFKYVGL